MNSQHDNQALQNVFRILEACATAKLMLSLDGDNLRIRLPEGMQVDKELLAAIRDNKTGILRALRAAASKNETVSPIERVSQRVTAPLSYAQESMWLATQFFDTRDMFNFCAIINIEGQPDPSALQHAVTEVVKRHATLRTVVSQQANGDLIQQVMPATPATLKYVDLSGQVDEADGERFISKVFSERFQLDQHSLHRTHLIKLRDGRFKFIFVTHHIASDGWSIDLLLREISEIYNARVERRDAELKPLSIDFIDYATWERSEAGVARLANGLKYWRSRLQNVPRLHSLPMDRPRPPVQTFTTQSFERWLDRELLQRLEAYAVAKGTTLFVVLMTAFATLCCRSGKSTDIVVGTPIANRLREEVAPLIGLFMNMLAFRVTLDEMESFDQLLARCQINYLQDIQHQGIPFDRVVTEVCGSVHDQRYAPLVQICFALHNNALDDVSMHGLVCSTDFKLSASSQYDLNVASQIRKDGLYVLWQYSTDIFSASRVEHMATRFENLLQKVLQNSSSSLMSLLPVTEDGVARSFSMDREARMKLLQMGNDTVRPFDRNCCVHHLFARQVELTPHNIALVFRNIELTYAQLGARVNQLASYLRRKRLVKADVLVGVYLQRSPELLVSQLAIMQAGGAYLPLDREYPLARLSYMVQDASIRTVLTTRDAISQGLVTEAQALCWDDRHFLDALKTEPEEFVDHNVGDHGDNLAYVIYTSGSTGKPKGVMLEHKGLSNFLLAMQREPGIELSDRLLAITSNCFDIHTLEMYLPLITGATMVMAAKEEYADPVALIRLVVTQGITIMQATPTTWLTMLDAGWNPERDIKCLCGGEALQPGLKNKLRVFPAVQLWNMYGPTETSVWSSVKRIHNDIAIGPPIANTTFYILNEELEPVPCGVEGELYIGGVGLARGYLNKPDLTQAAFITTSALLYREERIYRTGDSVKRHANGDITFMGRVDNQVKIRGFRIEIGEIVASFEALAQIKRAAVVVRKRDDGSQYLAAFIVKNDGDWEVESALTAIAQTLPEHMVPTTIMQLDQLPLTPNGKVDLRALSEIDNAATSDNRTSGSHPLTHAQRLVTRLWAELLSVDEKTLLLDTNLFNYGVDSLRVLMFVGRMKKKGFAVSPAEVQRSKTIRAIADIVTKQNVAATTDLYNGPAPLLVDQLVSLSDDRVWRRFYTNCLLDVPQPIDVALMQVALEKLLSVHDLLRSRFRKMENVWQLIISGDCSQAMIEAAKIAASWRDAESAAAQLREILGAMHDAMPIDSGPLIAARLISDPDGAQKLLLSISHLVADGFSFAIVLEDLFDIYVQLQSGVAPKLENWSPLRVWSEKYEAFCCSTKLYQQLDYWEGLPWKTYRALPLDYKEKNTDTYNVSASSRFVPCELDESRTTIFANFVSRQLGIQPAEFLLLMAVRFLMNWGKLDMLGCQVVDTQRNFMEQQLGIDFSRTVGAFAFNRHLFIVKAPASDVLTEIRHMHDQLQQVPLGGAGLQILKFAATDAAVRERARAIPAGEFAINYFGSIDMDKQGSDEQVVSRPVPSAFMQHIETVSNNPLTLRSRVFGMSAAIKANRLNIWWEYSEHLHRESTVTELADLFRREMEQILDQVNAEHDVSATMEVAL